VGKKLQMDQTGPVELVEETLLPVDPYTVATRHQTS
jgi:hypothetical protein